MHAEGWASQGLVVRSRAFGFILEASFVCMAGTAHG